MAPAREQQQRQQGIADRQDYRKQAMEVNDSGKLK